MLTLCGVDLDFAVAPGAARDHLVVWHTEGKVLISGDNCCRSFPSLCAVRGTACRDSDTWADIMIVLGV